MPKPKQAQTRDCEAQRAKALIASQSCDISYELAERLLGKTRFQTSELRTRMNALLAKPRLTAADRMYLAGLIDNLREIAERQLQAAHGLNA